MHKTILAALLFGCTLVPGALWASPTLSGIGLTPTPAQIHGWDVDISADGDGLPAGAGAVPQGQQVYATRCAACHGTRGEGGPMDRLVGGTGSLNGAKPIKTVGSYWPHATTLFDYIRRAMPFNAPGTLTNDQVYAVTAYLLYLNGIVSQNAVMNARTLPSVAMPNRENFIENDPRPDAP
jgi:S-disulfanyl-L-cysteine oxidoreductase SoxD